MSTQNLEQNAGRITLATLLSLVAFSVVAFLFSLGQGGVSHVSAAPNQRATTTVTVLNTPPQWTVNAAETPASATTTPTNVGATTTWVGTATDGNNEDYFMIICRTDAAPTPNPNAPPTCSGGSTNLLALSATTSSGSSATATRVALHSDAETVQWYAFVCDFNAGQPACNATFTGHSGGATSSPFVVNHAPSFTVFADDSPTLPGAQVTWTTTASDADTLRTDQFTLYVCRAADFTGTGCGAGGGWATSTLSTSNPTATTTIPIPTRDTNYAAYGYIVDTFGLVASGTAQGSNSILTVANATPSIENSIDLGSSTDLILTVPQGETPGFILNFQVSDNNSCLNASSGNEIDNVFVNIHRSGIASSSCNLSGDYNPNNCYPQDVGIGTWNLSCSQVSGSCLGATDTTADFTCTFPLWFLADPTDVGSQFPSQTWVATVRATDDNFATSSWRTSTGTTELLQFLAFSATGSPIAYGSLEPGFNTGILSATTSLIATGNTGLDQQVFGTNMCTTYPTCSGNATSTIFPGSQEYSATSGVAYGSGIDLTSSTSSTLFVNVRKSTTTATATLSRGNTYWGIEIPSAIAVAGDYYGVNTLIGVVSSATVW